MQIKIQRKNYTNIKHFRANSLAGKKENHKYNTNKCCKKENPHKTGKLGKTQNPKINPSEDNTLKKNHTQNHPNKTLAPSKNLPN